MGYIGVITHLGFGGPVFEGFENEFCWAIFLLGDKKNVKKSGVLLGCFLLLALLKSWKKCESLVFIFFFGEFVYCKVVLFFASLVSFVTIFCYPP